MSLTKTQHILLCGLPKSGKTTLGEKLASTLGWPFLDTDRLVEHAYITQTGQPLSCREIYLRQGEQFFRTLENNCVRALHQHPRSIVALGGGTLPTNPQVVTSLGTLIYLQTSPETVWNRIVSTGIPAYLDTKCPQASFYALAKQRLPIYDKLAHVILCMDGLSEETSMKRILMECYGK